MRCMRYSTLRTAMSSDRLKLPMHVLQAVVVIAGTRTSRWYSEIGRPLKHILSVIDDYSVQHVSLYWLRQDQTLNTVTPTTVFLMRQLIVASRLGRTEYQLLLMKIS